MVAFVTSCNLRLLPPLFASMMHEGDVLTRNYAMVGATPAAVASGRYAALEDDDNDNDDPKIPAPMAGISNEDLEAKAVRYDTEVKCVVLVERTHC